MTDALTAPDGSVGTPSGRRAPDWVILVIACVAQFMVVLDVSIVNVALPSIGRDLHYSPTGLQWVVNAYVLTFAGFLLLGGRAADLFGQRRVYLSGMVLFTVASLAGGIATDSAWLTAARAVQGIAGAVLSPATLTIIITTFSAGRRARRGGRLDPGRRAHLGAVVALGPVREHPDRRGGRRRRDGLAARVQGPGRPRRGGAARHRRRGRRHGRAGDADLRDHRHRHAPVGQHPDAVAARGGGGPARAVRAHRAAAGRRAADTVRAVPVAVAVGGEHRDVP